MSCGRAWTTTEVRRLHELRAKRVPAKKIGAELGRTVDAIYSFLRYVPAAPGRPPSLKPTDRLPPREIEVKDRTDLWKREEEAMLREMASEGASSYDVAEAIGRSRSAVLSKASKLGVSFRYSPDPSVAGSGRRSVEMDTRRYQRNAVEGSAMLRDAIISAFPQMFQPESIAA